MIYFTAHTFKCVCHCIRTMFRVLGVYNFAFNFFCLPGSGGGSGVLENIQDMISLAKSEVGVLRELARNVTDSGKELNLWEILDAINATVLDNPNSGIAKVLRS